jgi:hypothetical protein
MHSTARSVVCAPVVEGERTPDVLLLGCRFFWTRGFLDTDGELGFGLVLVHRSGGMVERVAAVAIFVVAIAVLTHPTGGVPSHVRNQDRVRRSFTSIRRHT